MDWRLLGDESHHGNFKFSIMPKPKLVKTLLQLAA
jgi:hypothetical protein